MDRKVERRKAVPRLFTPEVEMTANLRSALHRAEEPLSPEQIQTISEGWSPRPTRKMVNDAIEILTADGLVAEGSKGLIWVPEASSKQQGMVRKARELDRQLAQSQLTRDDVVRFGRPIRRSATRRKQ